MALPFPPPASLDPSFSMSRPTSADVDALAQLYHEAFWLSKACTWWWSPDAEAMTEWLRGRVAGKMGDRGVRHFQVLDNNNNTQVVAFARWDVPRGYEDMFGEYIGNDDDRVVESVKTKKEEDEKERQGEDTAPAPADADAAPQKTIVPPRGADAELCRHFFSKLTAVSKKWNASEMLGLSLLCTSPKYERRGAGKALLMPMLAIADELGLRSYVEATAAGYPLYEKLGFRTVDELEFDLVALTGGKWEGREVEKLTVMIREPQLRQQS